MKMIQYDTSSTERFKNNRYRRNDYKPSTKYSGFYKLLVIFLVFNVAAFFYINSTRSSIRYIVY